MRKLIFFLILFFSLAYLSNAVISINKTINIPFSESNVWDPVLSTDGNRIAYAAYDNNNQQQIFVMDIDGSNKMQITHDDKKKWGLSWGPEKIAYLSYGNDGLEKVFLVNPEGTENRLLFDEKARQGNPPDSSRYWGAPAWSPDGKKIVYTSYDMAMNEKLNVVNADGTEKKQLIMDDTSRQWNPSWNPDGKKIVFISYNSLNKEELFTVNADGSDMKKITGDQIKKKDPRWGPEGIIIYISFENNLAAEKLFAVNEDGTGKRRFIEDDHKQLYPSWNAKGDRFLYAAVDIKGNMKINLEELTGFIVPAPTGVTEVTQVPTAAPEITTPTQTPEGTPGTTPVASPTESFVLPDNVIQGTAVVIVIIIVAMVTFLVLSSRARSGKK